MAVMTLVALLALAATGAHAATTVWKCGPSHCKYDQARVDYSGGSGLYAVNKHQIRGSTASGTCDPSNSGVRWRIQSSEVWVDGVRQFLWGPSVYYTNCQIDNAPPPPGWWNVTVNKTYNLAGSAYSKQVVFHDHSCAGCDFTDTITHSLPTS